MKRNYKPWIRLVSVAMMASVSIPATFGHTFTLLSNSASATADWGGMCGEQTWSSTATFPQSWTVRYTMSGLVNNRTYVPEPPQHFEFGSVIMGSVVCTLDVTWQIEWVPSGPDDVPGSGPYILKLDEKDRKQVTASVSNNEGMSMDMSITSFLDVVSSPPVQASASFPAPLSITRPLSKLFNLNMNPTVAGIVFTLDPLTGKYVGVYSLHRTAAVTATGTNPLVPTPQLMIQGLASSEYFGRIYEIDGIQVAPRF